MWTLKSVTNCVSVLSIITIGLVNASQCSAEPIRILSKSITADPAYGTALTNLTISVSKEEGADGSIESQINLQIMHSGFINSINGHSLLNNQRDDLVAINFTSATKTNEIYLISTKHGQIQLLPDVNSDLITLCRKTHRQIDPFYISVRSIRGRTLRIVSISYPKLEYDMSVNVSALGGLSIINYKVIKMS